MSAYRFCRTDDVRLLARAHDACLPDEPSLDEGALKRLVREQGLWCSSSMVAFEGDEPVGFLYGCKRPPETLVLAVGVREDHRRRGHARHLLTSLSAKLSILGPPRLVAEIPAENAAALGLFAACGWREDRWYVDYVLEHPGAIAEAAPAGLVSRVGVEPLAEMGALRGAPLAWERRQETLLPRGEALQGYAVASEEGLESYLVVGGGEIASIWCARTARGETALVTLLRHVAASATGPLTVSRLSPEEVPYDLEAELGFVRGREVVGLATEARGA